MHYLLILFLINLLPFHKSIFSQSSPQSVFFEKQTAYVDICDDTDYSQRAKSFHSEAVAAGVPAITTGGIYPGVSNGITIDP